MKRCEFPNGNAVGDNGAKYPISCEKPAAFSLRGWSFCVHHAGMVARGCLELLYSNGETIREAMEKTALYRLLHDP